MNATAGRLAEALHGWGTAGGPLYRQLGSAIQTLAEAGALEYGCEMPSERELAATLHVSRNTVKAAYQLLRDQQWLEVRPGRSPLLKSESRAEVTIMPRMATPFEAMQRGADVVDLASGHPDPAPIVQQALVDPRSVVPDLEIEGSGLSGTTADELREAIAQLLARQGIDAVPEEVVITSGGLHDLSLVLDSVVARSSTVVLEDIVWGDVPDAIELTRARVACMPMDGDGVIAEQAARVIHASRPEVVFTTNFHNPTGYTLSEDAALAILEAAGEVGAMVVDNRCAADLAIGMERPRPLASYGTSTPIVTFGTASKVFWPGISIGWMHTNATFARHLQRRRDFHDCGAPPVMQRVLAALIRDHYDDTVQWRRKQIRASMDAALDRIAQHGLPFETHLPPGGAWLWLKTPGFDPEALVNRAIREGLLVMPGSLFAARPDADTQAIRLCAFRPPEMMVEGVDRLAKAA